MKFKLTDLTDEKSKAAYFASLEAERKLSIAVDDAILEHLLSSNPPPLVELYKKIIKIQTKHYEQNE